MELYAIAEFNKDLHVTTSVMALSTKIYRIQLARFTCTIAIPNILPIISRPIVTPERGPGTSNFIVIVVVNVSSVFEVILAI